MSGVVTDGFTGPIKCVRTQSDVECWLKSSAYAELLGFITLLNKSVKGKSLKCNYEVSDYCKAVNSLFAIIEQVVDDIPLEDQGSQRFGNKAFRILGKRIEEKSEEWIKSILPDSLHNAVIELKPYFDGSFGSFVRIDYGTGHEISFLAFVCCLYKIGHLSQSDNVPTVFFIFVNYLNLMRRIQIHYNLEPAGSQGVWGLDDYQFLPFIFGSSQLIANPEIAPKDFVDTKVVEKGYSDYMFLGCIKFITDHKKGPFSEHSNQLWNISGVPTWSKVNSGLIKMYKAEVLCKQPVIQHFVFGSLLSFEEHKPLPGIQL